MTDSVIATILSWDGLRFLNALLSLGVVAALTFGSIARWEIMPVRIRRITPWVICTYGIISYGSVEVALEPEVAPAGLRVGLLTLNLCGMMVASLFGIWDSDYESETERSFWRFKR